MLTKAISYLRTVAIAQAGGAPGTVSYGDFCSSLKLGDPYHNKYMDQLLLSIMAECDVKRWPDLAALVVHAPGGAKEGPGNGWYEAKGYWPGDIAKWKWHRNDCWQRASIIPP
jgi:hypothetical protein